MIERNQLHTPQGVLSYLHRPGTGRPVVFLHGMTNAAMAWPSFFDAVAPRPCFALDFPGHGQSGRRLRYHFDVDRDAAVALLEHIGETSLLVGHSMGGLAAFAAAAERPEQVAGVFLEDVNPLYVENNERRNFALLPGVFTVPKLVAELHAEGHGLQWLADRLGGFAHDASRTVSDVLSADAITAWAEQALGLDPDRIGPKLSMDPPSVPAREQLRRYQGPVHIAHGDPDSGSMVKPAELDEIRRHNPSATTTRYPGGGHLLHSQHADIFAEDLAQFAAHSDRP